ncbi:hypothetical protein BCV70DRAFT_199889 [Testicularia cyperi]|uniref:C2H2-type domain-containing protein n=1 Tax=Testicularia cyperi TaxID=1882483 RepID=A0A317XQN3_9BASI|nr:hypothetical protein BCV70DRAFT_199889 [Testicularia cyperi]
MYIDPRLLICNPDRGASPAHEVCRSNAERYSSADLAISDMQSGVALDELFPSHGSTGTESCGQPQGDQFTNPPYIHHDPFDDAARSLKVLLTLTGGQTEPGTAFVPVPDLLACTPLDSYLSALASASQLLPAFGSGFLSNDISWPQLPGTRQDGSIPGADMAQALLASIRTAPGAADATMSPHEVSPCLQAPHAAKADTEQFAYPEQLNLRVTANVSLSQDHRMYATSVQTDLEEYCALSTMETNSADPSGLTSIIERYLSADMLSSASCSSPDVASSSSATSHTWSSSPLSLCDSTNSLGVWTSELIYQTLEGSGGADPSSAPPNLVHHIKSEGDGTVSGRAKTFACQRPGCSKLYFYKRDLVRHEIRNHGYRRAPEPRHRAKTEKHEELKMVVRKRSRGQRRAREGA